MDVKKNYLKFCEKYINIYYVTIILSWDIGLCSRHDNLKFREFILTKITGVGNA